MRILHEIQVNKKFVKLRDIWENGYRPVVVALCKGTSLGHWIELLWQPSMTVGNFLSKQ